MLPAKGPDRQALTVRGKLEQPRKDTHCRSVCEWSASCWHVQPAADDVTFVIRRPVRFPPRVMHLSRIPPGVAYSTPTGTRSTKRRSAAMRHSEGMTLEGEEEEGAPWSLADPGIQSRACRTPPAHACPHGVCSSPTIPALCLQQPKLQARRCSSV